MTGIVARNLRVSLQLAILICLFASFGGCTGNHSIKNQRSYRVSSNFLGVTWNQGHARASVVSQDGGFSYGVPGGYVWWFGDTFRGSRDTTGQPHFNGGAVSCAVARLDEAATDTPPVLQYLLGPDGTVAQAIDFLPNESWDRNRIWPLSGIFINGKSYLYYALIELTGEGWGFKGAGSGLAYATESQSVHKRIQSPDGWRFPVAPTAILATPDWIWLYDVDKRKNSQGVWLSRVHPAQIENPDEYEFYSGPGPAFTRDSSRQTLFLKNLYGQVSVIWNDHLKKYLLASSSDLFHPREIRFYSAENPAGPWERAFSITVPEFRQGKRVKLVYCSYFHPELFRHNGRIINLTFSLHLEDGDFDVNNEMVEIEIKESHH